MSQVSQQLLQNRRIEQIGHALSRTLAQAIKNEEMEGSRSIDIDSARYIIFSDLHKGARNRADDFLRTEQAYNAALSYYYHMGHTLITLGDAEELWEEYPQPVLTSYEYTLKLEAKFHQEGRYLRFWGNHDDNWSDNGLVQQHLDPIYGGPPLQVREALRIHLTNAGEEVGILFLAHGHQGTTASDQLAFLSRPLVRIFWRSFQRLTGISRNTPATDWQLRDTVNRAMYNWASQQDNLVFIVGHTHRPVFLSRLHAAKIRQELTERQEELNANPDNPELRERVSQLAAELEWILSQDRQMPGPEGTMPTTKPCHFNTGCCCFYDGDITGIEIADGEIRLIRWPDDKGAPKPKILDRAHLLTQVFAQLQETDS